MRITTRTAAALALIASAGIANAAPSMTLTPGSGSYVVGDLVTLTLTMDFSGPDEMTLGGGTDIMWDTAFLALSSWDPIAYGDPGFSNPGTISGGLIDGFAFGDFNGLTGPAEVATATFELLAAGATSITMDDDADGITGPFVNALTFQPQDVTFIGADLDISGAAIPLPAAAWLLLGGMGTLLGFRRRTAG